MWITFGWLRMRWRNLFTKGRLSALGEGKGNSLLTAKEAIAHLWALQVQLQTVSNSLQSKYSDRTSLVLLESRGLLSSWIIYCLVFDATRTNYPLVQQTKEPFTSI